MLAAATSVRRPLWVKGYLQVLVFFYEDSELAVGLQQTASDHFYIIRWYMVIPGFVSHPFHVVVLLRMTPLHRNRSTGWYRIYGGVNTPINCGSRLQATLLSVQMCYLLVNADYCCCRINHTG